MLIQTIFGTCDVSLDVEGWIYDVFVGTALLCVCETWPLLVEYVR